MSASSINGMDIRITMGAMGLTDARLLLNVMLHQYGELSEQHRREEMQWKGILKTLRTTVIEDD